MLKSFVQETYRNVVEYGLRFISKEEKFFEFPCDIVGRLLPNLDDEMTKKYNECMTHPEQYPIFGMIVTYKKRVRIAARGICSCGTEIVFSGNHLDTYECPGCGSLYSHNGREIV